MIGASRQATAVGWGPLGGVALLLCVGCGADAGLSPHAGAGGGRRVLEVGEHRDLVLRYSPLHVTRFEKTITRQELSELPPWILDQTWLMNLEIVGEEDGPPRLMDYALSDLLSRRGHDVASTPAEDNLVRLLQMSAVTADLSATRLAPLIDLAPHLGFDPAEVLAAALGVDAGQPFFSVTELALAICKNVISTHPGAGMRRGPSTPAVPEGLYPVPVGALPVYLSDVLSDLETLRTRFGPTTTAGAFHPGFMGGRVNANLFGPDMRLALRANVNGVPDKGVDLDTASLAGVNSIDDYPDRMFDTSDPDWLRVHGSFLDPPRIGEMVFSMREDPRRFRSGDSPEPAPLGGSDVWTAPAYSLERVIATAAAQKWRHFSMERIWERGGAPLVEARIREGWLSIETPGDVGAPPPPAYVWDVLLDVAQVRLHDGGLGEGDAAVDVLLRDVPLGIPMADLIERIKAGVDADPRPFVALASVLFDNTWGDADFFYRRLDAPDADVLFFIEPTDIPRTWQGDLVRPYSYATVGFYADRNLEVPVGGRVPMDSDTVHWKAVVEPGQVLFVADERHRVYEITVGDKPTRASIALSIRRIR